MRDQHEPDTWNQDDVEIEDLGAPDRGFSRYLFALGEQWHTAGPLRARFFTLLIALCLLLAVLQSGEHSNSRRSTDRSPAFPSFHHLYLRVCHNNYVY